MRNFFILLNIILAPLIALGAYYYPLSLFSLIVIAPFMILGWVDYLQTSQTIRRNFPIFGRLRYLFESIRPEINQYFVESNTDGVPFSREQRSLVYQRAKHVTDTLPFGTQKNVYADGYEWVNHSIHPTELHVKDLRVTIGGKDCKHKYDISLFNISGMSYGALSKNAVLALNGGAADGHFAQNTGEGCISPYHLKNNGDLIWQIGTGYFGCRDEAGNFSEEKFIAKATLAQVKMIELKISQGAKPGHGGILPGSKVTQEIAEIRGIPKGKTAISPSFHSVFDTPTELILFLARLRDLSGGKPVGFKFCLGKHREFIAICKAMYQLDLYPDFIVVDGSEGGTGAAPLEFSNFVGMPGLDALVFVHNCLVGFGIRDRIKIGHSGKITSGFDIIRSLSIGADFTLSARAMMLALGCIQALRCNTNSCPAGVATQKEDLVAGLVPENKRKRVASYHEETLRSVSEILGCMGINSTKKLRPWHIFRRVSPTKIQNYGEIYNYIEEGALLRGEAEEPYALAMALSSPDTFDRVSGF